MSRRSATLLIVGSIAVLGTCLWFAFRGPVVTVNLASAKVDEPQFRIRTSGINRVLGLYVWSETKNEFLWALYVNNLPTEPVTYGKIPASATQSYPKDGSAPRKIQPGERFVVEVSYQYDTWMAASGSEHYFRFEADSAGIVKAMGHSEFIPGPKMP